MVGNKAVSDLSYKDLCNLPSATVRPLIFPHRFSLIRLIALSAAHCCALDRKRAFTAASYTFFKLSELCHERCLCCLLPMSPKPFFKTHLSLFDPGVGFHAVRNVCQHTVRRKFSLIIF